jgi:hypothetical protein
VVVEVQRFMKLLLPSPNCVFDTICYFFDAFINIPPAHRELPAIDRKPMKELKFKSKLQSAKVTDYYLVV